MSKSRNLNKQMRIAISATGLLLLAAVALPLSSELLPESTNAASCPSAPYMACTEVNVDVGSYATVALDKNTLTMTMDEDSIDAGAVQNGTVAVTVTTNSPYGYILKMESADNGYSTSDSGTTYMEATTEALRTGANSINSNGSNYNRIITVADSVDINGGDSTATTSAAGVALTANTWGYNWAANGTSQPGTYKTIPGLSGVNLRTVNGAVSTAAQQGTNVRFGVKVDDTIAADTYTRKIIFTATPQLSN